VSSDYTLVCSDYILVSSDYILVSNNYGLSAVYLFVVRVVQQELDLQAHRLDLEAQEVGVALVVQA